MNTQVTAFYKFIRIPPNQIPEVESEITLSAASLGIKGLIILAPEGANGTVAGSPEKLEKFKEFLIKSLGAEVITFKDSWATKNPFRRFKIKLRDEIVTLGKPEIFPDLIKNNHLPPAEWHKVLENEDVILLDTRNSYETALGIFENAVDPDIKTFNEFPEYIEQAKIPKEKKILMYCTGGIRCEKAIVEMQQRGYENVYQLEGGILKYIEEFPNGKFKGECFVFDHRVSVDQHLNPSNKYHLCIHCGDPGELKTPCLNCGQEAKICNNCAGDESLKTCSKNCTYHLKGQKDGYKAKTQSLRDLVQP